MVCIRLYLYCLQKDAWCYAIEAMGFLMFSLFMNKAEEFTAQMQGQVPDRESTRILKNAYNTLRGMGETVTASIRKSPYLTEPGRVVFRSDEPVAMITKFIGTGDWAQAARYVSSELYVELKHD